MKECETCMYFIPMLTLKGIADICMNPDSTRFFSPVRRDDSCQEWYTNEMEDCESESGKS